MHPFDGRVSAATVNGVSLLYVHIDGSSMDDAVWRAVNETRSLGLTVRRVELDPDTVFADAA